MSFAEKRTLLDVRKGGVSIIPPMAARGLTQTLRLIDEAGDVPLSVNGKAMNLSEDQFQIYESEITCTDIRAPALDGIRKGDVVVVDCVPEVCFPTSTASSKTRPSVADSEREEGTFTFYRMQLEMTVMDYQVGLDEYSADYVWRLTLRETELPPVPTA